MEIIAVLLLYQIVLYHAVHCMLEHHLKEYKV